MQRAVLVTSLLLTLSACAWVPSPDAGGPRVTASRPADGATDVPLNTGVATDLELPLSGVNPDTLTQDAVTLTNTVTGEQVPATIGSSGGFDTITLQPGTLLERTTPYRFDVRQSVTDQDGRAFEAYTATFTTGSELPAQLDDVTFEKVDLPVADGERYASLTFGPDGKLYAATVDGRVKRFTVGTDGTLGDPETFTALQRAEGGPRLTIGFTFAPDATAENLVAYVGHTYFGFNTDDGTAAHPWSGKITRLSGPQLGTVQDVVVGLPRSRKDHVTNSIAFRPSEPEVLYFNQGSTTAMGAPDAAWDFQPERLLSGATLRLDLAKLSQSPLDVQTEAGGTYNPFAADAPLTLYGRGIRNAYDLVWHSNGSLYVPANGSAAGGNIPRYNAALGAGATRPDGSYAGPVLDAPGDVDAPYSNLKTDGWKVTQTQNDYLFRVVEGGYYGHPNPKRCEWIMNGGGTPGDARVDVYPAGTPPDPNYRGAAFNFEKNKAPAGSLEYRSTTFGGALQGKLLVTRYSNGDDILVLSLNANGEVSEASTVTGLSGFRDPIDLAENPATGDLYIAEYDQFGRAPGLTLARPVAP